MKDRIESLARGVQGGIFAPNEARNSEGLESVAFGDEPRVQQQVVPLSQVGKIPAAAGTGRTAARTGRSEAAASRAAAAKGQSR